MVVEISIKNLFVCTLVIVNCVDIKGEESNEKLYIVTRATFGDSDRTFFIGK